MADCARLPAISPHMPIHLPCARTRDAICCSSARNAGRARVGDTGEFGILAVGGEEILAEIVGADAEEIELGAQAVEQKRRGRHFDHRAQRHGANGDACTRNCLARTTSSLNHSASSSDAIIGAISHTGPSRRRAQGRADLRGDPLAIFRIDAHAAIAQKRIALRGQLQDRAAAYRRRYRRCEG